MTFSVNLNGTKKKMMTKMKNEAIEILIELSIEKGMENEEIYKQKLISLND